MKLIDADQITDHEIIDYLGIRYASCTPDVRDLLNDQPTIEAVPVVDRNEVITEVLEAVKDVYHNFGGYDLEHMTKYGNKTAEQQHQSYSTMMMYEIASEFDDLIDRISMMLEV